MRLSKEELVAVLSQFNPWWRDEAIADLPDTTTRILRIPAPLLCYWMGESELAPEQQ
jgi:hypothetical protein